MATVGETLIAPESGWRRYDDRDSRFLYTGTWAKVTNPSYYMSTYTCIDTSVVCNENTHNIKFKFYGSKIRIIGWVASSGNSNCYIIIDGVQYTFSQYISGNAIYGALNYENLSLTLGMHNVEIYAINNSSAYGLVFDAIDIDDIGYLLHPILTEKTDIQSMEIGDCIRCRYTANSGVPGAFTELGTCDMPTIPVTGTATPDGLFYWIMVGYDHKGRKKLIADQNIQSSITWDVLNTSGLMTETQQTGYSYKSVDNNSSLNYASQRADNPVPIVFNNELYITWQEYTGSYLQIRVKKWDGSAWVSADNNSPLNYASQSAQYPVPIVFNNELYITWYESNGSDSQIRVKKWDGSAWVSADNNSSLNYNVSRDARYPVPIVFNNELYITWRESNGSNSQIRVKKWDGSAWVSADNNSPLNYNVSRDAYNPVPIVFNNELYITWQEYTKNYQQIRVKKWDGSAWVSADNNSPLNYNVFQSVDNPVPIVFNNELYITWRESNGSYWQIRVKKWSGSAWVSADNNSSLNYNASLDAQYPVPIVFNNELYITWYESFQIRVKKWDGSAWVSADNNSSLNYNASQMAENPVPIVFNNELYITWQEYAGSYWQIRVKQLIQSTVCTDSLSIKEFRLLTGGVNVNNTSNEWDMIICNSNLNGKITAGDDNIWHWSSVASWSSSVNTDNNTYRTRRGGTGGVTYITGSVSSGLSGLRPMMLVESLNSSPIISNNKITYKSNTEVNFTGDLTDAENNNIQYQILLNSAVYKDWTALIAGPIHINENITILEDQNNTITLNTKDDFGSVGTYTYTLKLKQIDGTYISTSNGDTNYYSDTNLLLRSDTIGLLKTPFDKQNGYLKSYILNFKVINGSNGTLRLAKILSNWSEYTVTNNICPNIGSYREISYTVVNGIVSIDITQEINDIISSGYNYGIAIWGTTLTADLVQSSLSVIQVATQLLLPETIFINKIDSIKWKPIINKNTSFAVDIKRNGVIIFQTTDKTVTEFEDTGLQANTEYTYVLEIADIGFSDSEVIDTPDVGYRKVLVNDSYDIQLIQGMAFDDASVDYNFYTTADGVKLRPLDLSTLVGGKISNIFAFEVINSFDTDDYNVELTVAQDNIWAVKSDTCGLLPDAELDENKTKVELSLVQDPFSAMYPMDFTLNHQSKQVVYLRVTPQMVSSETVRFQVKLVARPK